MAGQSQVINLVMEQGSTFVETFTIRDSNGSIVDMSSYSVSGQMRRHHESETYHAFTANGTSSGISISMTTAQTSNVDPGWWVYDVEAISTANVTSRPISGKISVRPQITR